MNCLESVRVRLAHHIAYDNHNSTTAVTVLSNICGTDTIMFWILRIPATENLERCLNFMQQINIHSPSLLGVASLKCSAKTAYGVSENLTTFWLWLIAQIFLTDFVPPIPSLCSQLQIIVYRFLSVTFTSIILFLLY